MTVNSKVFVHNVEVIEGCEGSPTFMPPQSLVFGSTPEELNDVVERATSFSCSLGGAMASVLLPLLESLPVTARDNQPQLFCCENDHDAVKALKEQLEGKVFVIDCTPAPFPSPPPPPRPSHSDHHHHHASPIPTTTTTTTTTPPRHHLRATTSAPPPRHH